MTCVLPFPGFIKERNENIMHSFYKVCISEIKKMDMKLMTSINPLMFFSIIFLWLISACDDNPVMYSEKQELPSRVHELEETYLLNIFLPKGVSFPNIASGESEKGLQVLYVLDADKHAEKTALTVHKLELPLITVGVGYSDDNRRERDYTPTNWQFDDAGGADVFFEFMEKDVFPFMETEYHVGKDSADRFILGWSLGGLAAIYVSLSNPDLFSGYITVSPSLMWDSQYIFSLEQEKRLGNNTRKGFIGLYAGSHEFPGTVAAVDAYYERLQSYYPNIITDFAVFNNRAHTSVFKDAVYHGLKACFNR